MAIRFYGKEGSENGGCPSVSVDEADGSFIFVGWPVNDPALIADIETYSPIDPGEQAFRVPKQLRKAIEELVRMMDPPRPLAMMCGAAARTVLKTPVRLVAITAPHSSAEVCTIGAGFP